MRISCATGIASLVVLAMTAAAGADVLVADRYGDRIMRFSSVDGSLIDLDYIPNTGLLNSAIEPMYVERGGVPELWVSDQNNDSVFRFSLGHTPTLLGSVVDASNNIDNIRGMALVGDTLWLTNFATSNGAPGPGVRRFNVADLDNVVDLGTVTATGMRSPWDVYTYNGNVLVGDDSAISANALADTATVHAYGSDGSYGGVFFTGSRATNGFSLPKQMIELANGNLLVPNDSGITPRLFELDTEGSIVAQYDLERDPADPNDQVKVAGLWELDNGQIFMAAQGTGIVGTNGIYTLDRSTGEITEMLIANGSGVGGPYDGLDLRMIPAMLAYVPASAIPEPGSAALLLLAPVALRHRRRR